METSASYSWKGRIFLFAAKSRRAVGFIAIGIM
jgi:hypothetical protein